MTRPAPPHVQIVRGDRPSRVRTPGPLPAFADGPPEAPSWLAEGARATWDELAPLLSEAGRLTPLDLDCFAAYCEHVELYRQAVALIQAEGIVVTGHRGAPRKHPAWQVLRDSAAMIRSGAQDFGLTPAARSGMHIDTRRATNEETARLLS